MDGQDDAKRYWESRLGRHFSLEGVGYEALGLAFNEWMYRVRRRVLDRALISLPLDWPSASVLDVGSGTGFYLDYWRERGVARVTGIDVTDIAINRLTSRFDDIDFLRADIGGPRDAIALPDASFDVASVMDVMFHVLDDDAYVRAFTNLAALVKKGGWLVFTENFVRRGRARVPHVLSRRHDEIVRVVSGAGFDFVALRPAFVLMNYPVDGSRAAQLAWTALAGPAALAEPAGWLLGATLYPLELLLTRVVRRGPSTKLVIARRR